MNTYRLILCIDVDAENLEDAYGEVYRSMGRITGPDTSLDWESSDEWFDEDGELGDPDVFLAARMSFFENKDRCKHGMFYSGAGACPQCGGGAE